jgi:hypothetical protein
MKNIYWAFRGSDETSQQESNFGGRQQQKRLMALAMGAPGHGCSLS